uniref:Aldolase_II domain-containing protein n=1 Tax=Rhabditophanes sp. KR3021 TaxID=114890 RepID=A0AC35U7W5_9BILA
MDRDDPEYIKDLQRPAAIKEDLYEMERRKRVQQILDSKNFCTQLENVIKKDIPSNEEEVNHLRDLERIAQRTLPNYCTSLPMYKPFTQNIIPIFDISNLSQYAKAEKATRCKLASLCRLIDNFQWTQGFKNHISARSPLNEKEMFINPHGLLYHEVTASSLLRLSVNGEILDGGSTNMAININKFYLHQFIYKYRQDVKCIIHIQTGAVSAVSSMKSGLLPICQEAIIIGPIGYTEFNGNSLNINEESFKFCTTLGHKNVIFIKNDGFLACGDTIEEAFYFAYNTITACETQLRAIKVGIQNLDIPNKEVVEDNYDNAKNEVRRMRTGLYLSSNPKEYKWKLGELEWEAWMRVLDNLNLKTGHFYKRAITKTKSQTFNQKVDDVATPPSSISTGALDESDPESLKTFRLAAMRKEQEKMSWMNSPNVYQKVRTLECGTMNPKVITKWIQDIDHLSGVYETPIPYKQSTQFSVLGGNPREFKAKQHAMKMCGVTGTKNAGPQSQIFDATSVDALPRPFNDFEERQFNERGHVVTFGAASKGIIQSKYRAQAQIFNQIYTPNPFSLETNETISDYITYIQNKDKKNKVIDNNQNDVLRSDADEASIAEAIQMYNKSKNNSKFKLKQASADTSGCHDFSLQDTTNIVKTETSGGSRKFI